MKPYSQGIKSHQFCFVVFSQLVGVELPRGVASIFVVPCKIEYNHSKYHSFVVFFLLIPCGTCCHELSGYQSPI